MKRTNLKTFFAIALFAVLFVSCSSTPKEIPEDLLEGYEEAMTNKKSSDNYTDSSFEWKYGNNNGKVTTYKSEGFKVEQPAYEFKRTAESFLSNLQSKKKVNIDVGQYQEGQRIYHKKFGEGTITKLEPEGDDFKVDISFDKVGHKRLMAKFAGLEIIK